MATKEQQEQQEQKRKMREAFEALVRHQAAKWRVFVSEAHRVAKEKDCSVEDALENLITVHVRKTLSAKAVAQNVAAAYNDASERVFLLASSLRKDPVLSMGKVLARLQMLYGNLRETAAAVVKEAETKGEPPSRILKPNGQA